MNSNELAITLANDNDLNALVDLENSTFEHDRLSKRRMRHWISAANAIFIVAKQRETLVGYALIVTRKGSLCARLYSIAVANEYRGRGIARQLLTDAERRAVADGLLFMRLEVDCNNTAAIELYSRLGYRQFGVYPEYYENSADAYRMQKPIRQSLSRSTLPDYPYYPQSTDFTCGSAALMMAMAHLDSTIELSQTSELRIWRRATSIYMTSGHGGSHPIGLALAARDMGMGATVYLSTKDVPFIDGVRTAHKKDMISAVHSIFVEEANSSGVTIFYQQPAIGVIQQALQHGHAVVCLISTYHFDDKKIPHWVSVTHIDDQCIYLHDPDVDPSENPLDYQHIPVRCEDYQKLACYGKQKLTTCVILSRQ